MLSSRQSRHVVVGPVVVSKMPALHPGDVRKFQAVSVPGLERLYDVIVFPQKVKYCYPLVTDPDKLKWMITLL